MNLFLDFETWSAVQIRKGTDVYMDNARPLIATYAFDDGPVQVHDFTDIHSGSEYRLPVNLRNAIQADSTKIIAHNAFFDRMVVHRLLKFDSPIHQWHCTFAQALAHSLPGGLGPLCEILKVPADAQKDADGMRLIRKFCGPKPFKKDEEWDKFIEYAVSDITAMRECYKRMPNWNYKGEEHRLWQVDQIINNRGFKVDVQLAQETVKALSKEKGRLDDAVWIATCGSVSAATQRDKLLLYLCEQQGCFLKDMTAPTLEEALQDEALEESTKDVLRIRLQASKTSTSKYRRMLESVGKDGRLRGTLQFSGAARTARWAGRIFQPHNLPRPTMKSEDIALCIDLFKDSRADVVPLIAPINEASSNALRGLITAEPGKILRVGDYSAIEGRGNAWISGEDWKLKAFREKQDLYKLIYSRSFDITFEDVTKGQRQIGKVMELALGYGGGVGAFLNMAAGYGMDLDELAKAVTPVEKAREEWEWAVKERRTFGLTQEVYIACATLKIGYRKANPAIVSMWYMLEDAARKAVDLGDPTKKFAVGALVFDCNGQWMRIKLPSGRFLCYALPRLHKNGSVSYMAWRNKQWSRTKTYGGKLVENIVQAISRDLLGFAILTLEAAGYPVVLHVHDEIISETPKGFGSLEEFLALMATRPKWAAGLPLAAEGFEGERYEKH